MVVHRTPQARDGRIEQMQTTTSVKDRARFALGARLGDGDSAAGPGESAGRTGSVPPATEPSGATACVNHTRLADVHTDRVVDEPCAAKPRTADLALVLAEADPAPRNGHFNIGNGDRELQELCGDDDLVFRR